MEITNYFCHFCWLRLGMLEHAQSDFKEEMATISLMRLVIMLLF